MQSLFRKNLEPRCNQGGKAMKSRFVTIAVVCLSIGIAGISRAGTPLAGATPLDPAAYGQEQPGGKLARLFQELKPTEDQKRQVADILSGQQAAFTAAAAALAEAWKGLRAQMQSDTFNEAAVRKACREVAVAGEEMAVLRAKRMSRIRAILTPEQKTVLARFQAEAGEDIAGRLGLAQAGVAQWIESHKTR
jgi:Spy/CpxP family protein refolding chaperone